MKEKSILITAYAMLIGMTASAQTLVRGGQFMDLLLPMEGSVAATTTDWGTTAGSNKKGGKWTGTLGRWKDNGIEDVERSYWGGNIVWGNDSLFHLYVAGWPERTPRGHMAWSSLSRVYHVTANNINGPYTFREDIGEGHNPETYRTDDGTYVIYIIGGRYTSRSINGPWTRSKYDFDLRGRRLVAGENRKSSLSNLSFARREDGSFLMVDRGGSMWVSRDGLHDAWHQITDHSIYQGNRRYYEDPVLWRDSVQYHLIVNDWNARKAYYMRSPDGRHWVQEAGTAYCADETQFPRIFSVHKDGTEERWYKYERPRIFQDKQGRAVYMNFAVIDCVKRQDKGGDNHSSKNIVLPLQKSILIELVSASNDTYTIRIKAEPDFNPKKELNLRTLRFGSHNKVNYNKGLKVKKTKVHNNDLIVTFEGSIEECGLTADEWAAKILGQKKDGSIAFGYVRLPSYNSRAALLTSLCPDVADGHPLRIIVSNYGQQMSKPTTVRIYAPDKKTILGEGSVPEIGAYNQTVVRLKPTNNSLPQDAKMIVVRFFDIDGKELCIERLPYKAQKQKLPIMGWSSWNTYHVNISDSLIMRQADAMVKNGLKDAGYKYINIDDGYFGGRDTQTGQLLIHPTRFPNGLKPVVDHIHGLGLRAGIYSDAGANTCGSKYDNDTIAIGVGLYGHDRQDCDFIFRELDFDFIKIDFCGGNSNKNTAYLGLSPQERYTDIRQAIDETGRRGVDINVCRWNYPGTWVSNVASSWRISQDIRDRWSSVKDIISQNLYLSAYAGNGHYNDMDMLEVGRNLTAEEDRTHFGMWCMMSSPLLIGCDLMRLKPATRSLLTNRELIALNQDPLGLQAYVVKHDQQSDTYVLAKDLLEYHGLTRAVALYNPTDQEQTVSITMEELELSGEVKVRDLYEQKDIKSLSIGESLEGTIPPHGCRIYRLTATKRLPRMHYEAETAFLTAYQELYNPLAVGTAYYTEDTNCSNGIKVTNLGLRPENDLQWRNVWCETDGEYNITIKTTNFSKKQHLLVNANNGDGMHFTAKDATADGSVTLTLKLHKGLNTVRLYCDYASMPDIDYMTIINK